MGDVPRHAHDEIVKLEERFWLEGGGNPDFWRRHCADDAVVVLPFGIMDKDQTVAAMEQAQPWVRVEMQDLRVVAVNDGCVLVAYRATAARAGDGAYSAAIGSVYVERDGSWQLAFHQQSPQDLAP